MDIALTCEHFLGKLRENGTNFGGLKIETTGFVSSYKIISSYENIVDRKAAELEEIFFIALRDEVIHKPGVQRKNRQEYLMIQKIYTKQQRLRKENKQTTNVDAAINCHFVSVGSSPYFLIN